MKLLAALAVLLAFPAVAGASCPRGGELSATRVVSRDPDHPRTAVVVCAGGRRLVPRRVRFSDESLEIPRGTLIGGAAAAGRRVAWIETRMVARRRTIRVVVARVGRRVTVTRRIVVLRDRSVVRPYVDVLITARGELAWLVPPRRGHSDQPNRVVVDLPGARPRVVEPFGGTTLALEDGSTVRWSSGLSGFGFYELPRRGRPACPRRERYRVVAENETVRVTERWYGSPDMDIGTGVMRACVRGEGPDRPIAESNGGFGNGEYAYVVGLAGTLVGLGVSRTSRYGTCDGETEITTVEARTGGSLRAVRLPRCGPDAPPPDRWVTAITTDGVLAWLDGARLLAAGPDGLPQELDRGTISGLRADGTLLRWSRDGEPRSVDPP